MLSKEKERIESKVAYKEIINKIGKKLFLIQCSNCQGQYTYKSIKRYDKHYKKCLGVELKLTKKGTPSRHGKHREGYIRPDRRKESYYCDNCNLKHRIGGNKWTIEKLQKHFVKFGQNLNGISNKKQSKISTPISKTNKEIEIKEESITVLPSLTKDVFDKTHLRVPTREKRPIVFGWTDHDYNQPKTIPQLLAENGEYGIRTGIKIGFGGYYLAVVIIQKQPTSSQDSWHSWVSIEETPFANISYIETESTYHFYLLIKEPPTGYTLYLKGDEKSCGVIFAKGRQVVGIDSKIGNFYYRLTKKEKDWAVYETERDLKRDLEKKKIFFVVQPKEEELGLDEDSLYNERQKEAIRAVFNGESIFMTGSAGTGKSFTLRKIVKILQRKYGGDRVGITAMTGVGATLIGGTTLHNCLGVGITSGLFKEDIIRRIMSHYGGRSSWQRLKALIIDEVSMLSGDFFDSLEEIARELRNNDAPFGGIQLILIGDFCQLPPVGKGWEEANPYAFESKAWEKCIQRIINLDKIYRQKKEWFISYLQSIRFGRLPKKRWEDMLEWCGKEPKWPQDGIVPTSLFATNKEVQDINERELAKLPGSSNFYLAKDHEYTLGKLKHLVKFCTAKERLELKVNAQVMLINNWHEEKLVNGDKGIVIGFTENKLPIVRFTNGKTLEIERVKWQKIEGYDANNEPIVSATRSQIPLILAWAITIDKSQGQSIERLIVDLKKCWRGGHIYTALSRATNPNYLQIINFSRSRMLCDPKVKDFYDRLDGKEIKPREEREVDEEKRKLWKRLYGRWNEWVWQYETKKIWPFSNMQTYIKKRDIDGNTKNLDTLLIIIERSISNKKNMLSYRRLIEKLVNWNKERQKELSKNSNINDRTEEQTESNSPLCLQ